jgi:hypothetical protein
MEISAFILAVRPFYTVVLSLLEVSEVFYPDVYPSVPLIREIDDMLCRIWR